MIVQGLIMSFTDITSKTNRDTMIQTGSINLLVTEPTQVIQVSVSQDLVASGALNDLKGLVGKQTNFTLEFRNSSWGDDSGKHRQYSGFSLISVPVVK